VSVFVCCRVWRTVEGACARRRSFVSMLDGKSVYLHALADTFSAAILTDVAGLKPGAMFSCGAPATLSPGNACAF